MGRGAIQCIYVTDISGYLNYLEETGKRVGGRKLGI